MESKKKEKKELMETVKIIVWNAFQVLSVRNCTFSFHFDNFLVAKSNYIIENNALY